jgi:hypothetical protein
MLMYIQYMAGVSSVLCLRASSAQPMLGIGPGTWWLYLLTYTSSAQLFTEPLGWMLSIVSTIRAVGV